jgi:hypothetical protein
MMGAGTGSGSIPGLPSFGSGGYGGQYEQQQWMQPPQHQQHQSQHQQQMPGFGQQQQMGGGVAIKADSAYWTPELSHPVSAG